MQIVKFDPKKLMSFIEETAGVSYYNYVEKDTLLNIKKNEPVLKSNCEAIVSLEEKRINKEKDLEDY